MFKIFLLSSITSALLLVGCGGGSGDTTTTEVFDGQLIDSFLENVDYSCGDTTGVTDINGGFSCDTFPVTFKLGGLTLGSIDSVDSWPSDNLIFPQDLLGVARTDLNNTDVIAMATFLQSCDEDSNTSNGIKIHDSIKSSFTYETNFNADDISMYAVDADLALIEENDALTHLETSIHTVIGNEDAGPSEELPANVIDAINLPLSNLTSDIEKALAFMGNEERLAYDVYTSLFELWPSQNILDKIPNNAEIKHAQAIKELVKKYSLDASNFVNDDGTPFLDGNTSISQSDDINDVTGVYDIQSIQDLYNTLMDKGAISERDALEVGCMIEVTDINDLNIRIEQIEEVDAPDVLTVFNYLRDGSFSHYWSFNGALQTIGIEDGCCILGDFYCKTTDEYPNDEHGNKPDTAGSGH